MSWQEQINIPRVHLGGTESYTASLDVLRAMSHRFQDSAAYSHHIFLTEYPDLEEEFYRIFPDVAFEDFGAFTTWLDTQPTRTPAPDLTRIPQKHGAAHFIKKAQLCPQEFFIMNREPNNPAEAKIQNIPGKRYTAPFFVLTQYVMDITGLEPDSQVVRRLYPLSATVQSVFLPVITAHKHAKWETPQFSPSFIGESMLYWDEISADKLMALDIRMRSSKMVHQAVTSEYVRVPIQAKGMSGKG